MSPFRIAVVSAAGLALLTVDASLCRAAGEERPAPATINWLKDPSAALRMAASERRPILIDFWATWCGPCRDMEHRLWSRADLIPLSRKFVCLRVDVDQRPELAQRYRAEALPTVVLSDPWGNELARREGFGGPDPYLALLQAMPGDFSEVAPWHERLAANPKDVDALRGFALGYHRLKLFQASNEILDKALASKDARARPEALADILTLRGWNHLKLGDLKSARKEFTRCLKDVPEQPEIDATLYGLLAVALASGSTEEAPALLARLETCCASSPFTARARRDLDRVPSPQSPAAPGDGTP